MVWLVLFIKLVFAIQCSISTTTTFEYETTSEGIYDESSTAEENGTHEVEELTTSGSYEPRGWSREEIPDPQTYEGSLICGRGGTPSWICDPHGFINPVDASGIDRIIYQWIHDPYLPCPCHERCTPDNLYFRIYVIVVDYIKIDGNFLVNDAQRITGVKEMSEYLRDHTFYGANNCNDSMIIVLSVFDKTIWTAMGTIFLEDLYLVCSEKIYKEASLIFAAGYNGDALFYMVDEYIAVLYSARP